MKTQDSDTYTRVIHMVSVYESLGPMLEDMVNSFYDEQDIDLHWASLNVSRRVRELNSCVRVLRADIKGN